MTETNTDRTGFEPASNGTWDELVSAIERCRLCPLSLTRTRTVPGEGNRQARLMFVGEGPGFEEDRQGRPFVGRSGRYLIEKLSEVGIRRRDVYMTNVVKCRPPENRDPQAEEADACSAYLARQVALVNPRIIVTLGRISTLRWFEKGAITRLHGTIRPIGRGRVAVALLHPAAALRNVQWQAEFERDLQKLPMLMARARRADAAAARGEGLPAGVPHPGEPDYDPVALGKAAATNRTARTSHRAQREPEEGLRRSDDDAVQLSLF